MQVFSGKGILSRERDMISCCLEGLGYSRYCGIAKMLGMRDRAVTARGWVTEG